MDNTQPTGAATYTLSIEQGIGYSGKHGSKAYCARVVGLSDRFGLDREFLDADEVKRDHFGRAKYTRTYTYQLAAGLYDVSEGGARRWLLVWGGVTKPIGRCNPSEERAMEMARLMSAGKSFSAARVATKPVTA